MRRPMCPRKVTDQLQIWHHKPVFTHLLYETSAKQLDMSGRVHVQIFSYTLVCGNVIVLILAYGAARMLKCHPVKSYF